MLACDDGPALLRLYTSKTPNASEKRYQPIGKKEQDRRARRNNARALRRTDLYNVSMGKPGSVSGE